MMFIGTANFGTEYFGQRIDKESCLRLLDMAHEAGWGIETSMLYGDAPFIVHEWLKRKRAFVIGKANADEWTNLVSLLKPDLVLSHGAYNPFLHDGASLYDVRPSPHIVEAPFSILNQEWAPHIAGRQFYARSIFCRGKVFAHKPLLDLGDPLSLCLGFVRSFPVTGIVVGVESEDQLRKIISANTALDSDTVSQLISLDVRCELRASPS